MVPVPVRDLVWKLLESATRGGHPKLPFHVGKGGYRWLAGKVIHSHRPPSVAYAPTVGALLPSIYGLMTSDSRIIWLHFVTVRVAFRQMEVGYAL